jgi:starch-binding outer membrane protein, SusD/RagB family
LIQAEAALPVHGGSGQTWLQILNALRTDGTQTGGVFNPGGGNVAGLAPLTDPGSDSARVSLLFRERAFWLFLTGHRQGDMRRLIRQYGRPTETVFPTGPYYLGGTYKTAVAFEPFGEAFNPNFHGCVDENP